MDSFKFGIVAAAWLAVAFLGCTGPAPACKNLSVNGGCDNFGQCAAGLMCGSGTPAARNQCCGGVDICCSANSECCSGECDAGACSCLPAGGPCLSNADCCSANCAAPATNWGKGTCG